MAQEIILENTFLHIGRKNTPVTVQLTSFSIEIIPDRSCLSCGRKETILLEDVVGASISSLSKQKSGVDNNNVCLDQLQIHWYPKTWKKEGGREVHFSSRHTLTFRPLSIETSLDLWRKGIRYCIRGLSPVNLESIAAFNLPPEKPVLFLVNPKSGPGRAEKIFRQIVEPLLKEAGRTYECILTSRKDFGKDYLLNEDLRKWSSIIVVSGDGLMHEVINGLFMRDDWASALQTPLGIIPGGSGNGVAKSLAYENEEAASSDALLQATLLVVRGRPRPMDLVCVETAAGPLYSCLSVGYGLISDLDIESEGLRMLGEMRFPIWSVWRVLNLRVYKARLSYLQAEGHQSSHEMREDRKKGSFLKKSTSLSVRDLPSQPGGTRDRYFSIGETHYDSVLSSNSLEEASCQEDSVSDQNSDIRTFHSLTEWNQYMETAKKANMPDLGVPGLDQPVPKHWITLEDDFVLIYGVIQSHISSSTHFSPPSKMADGVIWLTVIRRGASPNKTISRLLVAQFLSKLQAGEHMFLPGVEVIPVKSFRLEPAENRGLLAVDGELIPTMPIQATVLPSMVSILS